MSEAIQIARMRHDIECVAACTEVDPVAGYSRPTFSPAWVAARNYVIDQATRAGADCVIDPNGNVRCHRAPPTAERPLWLCGSHLDSVPTGGKYDGVAGVVAGLEILRAFPHAPLELIIFAEEEGTTFQLGMLGSHAWVGGLNTERLEQLQNADGKDYFSAGEPCGVDRQRLAECRLEPKQYRGLIEIHIEQGRCLWDAGAAVGLVQAIHGRRQFEVRLQGEANHAGSTHMQHRRDALAAAAEMIQWLESQGQSLSREQPGTVVTVGRIMAIPNARNVIAGQVEFCVDFRAATDELLRAGDRVLPDGLAEIARRRGISCTCTVQESLPAIPLDPTLCARLQDAAVALRQEELPLVTSGALHDAAIVAPHLATAMLFIASRDGISHHPAEFSRVEDLALAARIVAEVVTS